MRVTIFTEPDYTFMFNGQVELVARLQNEGHEVCGIYVFPNRLGKYKGLGIYTYYLKTFGTGVFLKLAIVALGNRLRQVAVATISGQPFTYRGLGKKFKVPVLDGSNPNDEEVVSWVKRNHIDVIFITLGYIIREPLLQAVKVAILNKHSALLPAYRGLLPIFWTLLGGSISPGVTVHKVDQEIDTGEILFQQAYANLDLRSVFDYYKEIYKDLANSFMTGLEVLLGKRAKQQISFTPASSYFSLPTRKDYQDFVRKGYKFI